MTTQSASACITAQKLIFPVLFKYDKKYVRNALEIKIRKCAF